MCLFSGFFVPVDAIPVAIRWLTEIDPLRFAFTAAATVQIACDSCSVDEEVVSISQATCNGGFSCNEVCKFS